MMSTLNPKPSKSRLAIASFIFIFGWCTPLFIPLVLLTDYSAETKTILSSLLAFGIPEIFTFATIAILGKDGFEYFKHIVYKFFRRTFVPTKRVSRRRYHIGLIFFTVPLLAGLLLPYAIHLIPQYVRYHLSLSALFDMMFLLSLFILGGDFWEKLRVLYIYK